MYCCIRRLRGVLIYCAGVLEIGLGLVVGSNINIDFSVQLCYNVDNKLGGAQMSSSHGRKLVTLGRLERKLLQARQAVEGAATLQQGSEAESWVRYYEGRLGALAVK